MEGSRGTRISSTYDARDPFKIAKVASQTAHGIRIAKKCVT